MKSAKRRDTGPELKVRRRLFRMGFRYRVDISPVSSIRSRADLVFKAVKVAVFIDGCFWHGCPEHGTWPKQNGDWWRRKIEANQHRDWRVTEQLRDSGWLVLRFWEHQPADAIADEIADSVRKRQIR
ncbi:MAG: very short patch repair endonuclease [Myxococcales bacterium]|nr:very short patch repair endonuclease [Myxococcales bacterium]